MTALRRDIRVSGVLGKYKYIFVFLLSCLLLLALSYAHSHQGESYSHAAGIRSKRVLSVSVSREDSLWGIAERYYTPECGDMKEYIQEIKRCNSLEKDTIYAGSRLLVPVWATDQEAVTLAGRKKMEL